MNLKLSDYVTSLGDYAGSIAGITFNAAITAIIVLILSIIVLILLRKVILIKRRHKILKFLSISYFVIIPIICAFFGFKWQFLNKLGNNVAENITKETKVVDNLVKIKLAEVINPFYLDKSENLEGKIPISVNDLIDILADSLYVNYVELKKTNLSTEQNDYMDKALELYIDITKSKGLSFLIKEGLSQVITKQLKIEQETTKEMMDTKLGKLFDDGILSKIVDTKIRSFFGGLKKSVLTTLGIILLIPTIEILIAFWLHKKDKKLVADNTDLTTNSNDFK